VLTSALVFISWAAQSQPDERARGVRSTPFQTTITYGSNESKNPGCEVARSANLTIAALYGSSSSPHPGDIKSTLGQSCGSSSMPAYSQAITRNITAPTLSLKDRKMDCSYMASFIQCRAGNNIKPNDESCKGVTTADMIGWGKGNDCFERVTDGKVQAGDMIVTRKEGNGSGHVVTICNQKEGGIGPDDFTSCEASSTKTGIVKKSLGEGTSATARALKNALAGGDGGGNWTVLRHKGDKVPGCKAKAKRQIEGEQCVQSCPGVGPEVTI